MGRGVRTAVLGSAMVGVVTVGAEAQEVVDLPETDRPLTVRVEDVFQLGGMEADGWEAFENLRDVGFDGRGLLHLLDQGAGVVRVVGPEGGLVRTLGGSGDGPGEFSAPTGMAVATDGFVAVQDLGRRSLALFGPGGEYLRNVAPDGSRGRVSSFELDARHRVVGIPPVVHSTRRGSSEVEVAVPVEGGLLEDPPGLPLLRVDLEGGEPEVLRWTWIPPREADGGRTRETAFLPRVRWGLLPDGRVAVADSLDYRIHLLGRGEEVILRRPVPVRETTAADRRAEVGRRLAEPGGVGSGGGAVAGTGASREEATDAMRRQRRAALDGVLAFFPELQVIRGLRVDASGRLWIERLGEDPTAPGPLDVITADGRYLGTVPAGSLALPDAFAADGRAVWVERDELGVPVVAVRRVVIEG